MKTKNIECKAFNHRTDIVIVSTSVEVVLKQDSWKEREVLLCCLDSVLKRRTECQKMQLGSNLMSVQNSVVDPEKLRS